MSKGRLSQVEQRITHLVEGSFARLFSGRLHPREVAIRLTRAMDENAHTGIDGVLIAPNVYRVRLNPEDCATLLAAQPNLSTSLAEHIMELTSQADMRLLYKPSIELEPDANVPQYAILVDAYHVEVGGPATESMQPIPLPPSGKGPRNPQLMLGGTRAFPLDRPVMNIGRRNDNHIVVDDPRISRQHAQLRLRFNRYVIYDLNSKGGTFVNEHRISECILRTGDVISLAGVMLVYLEDDTSDSQAHGAKDTQIHHLPINDDDSTV